MEREILELLKDKKPRTAIEIIEYLDMGSSYDDVICKHLKKLVDEYELYLTKKNKYMLFSDSEESRFFFKGKFSDTANDYGFVDIGEDSDIFIHGSNNIGAIDGDTVLVKLTKNKSRDKKREGIIVKIIAHDVKNKVGEVYHYQGKMMLSLDDKKYKKLIILDGPKSELNRLVDGDKVLATISHPIKKNNYLFAKYIKRIGNINDPDIDILSIIADNEFDIEYPPEVEEELKTIPTEVSKKDLTGRKDLRKEMIFTIDGDDTKDIDDAISLKKLKNGNYELGVHIADVTNYVKENTPLDLEARKRGTSVYLTDRVIPMLPHQLSNGICSLNPGVDRLTVSCVMEINHYGVVVNHDIFLSVINSNLQMTYNKVNDYLELGIVNKGYEKFTDMLDLMKELSGVLRRFKAKRGAIDFDTDEAKIICDKDGKPIEITRRYRGVGEKIIEDFMIAANETVATHLQNMKVPSLYRVHGEPSEERLIKFLQDMKILGIDLKGSVRNITPKAIQKMINDLKKYPAFKVLNTKMLSCMDKAIYDTKNIGHFGIASTCYTHFTSPIRRYPDTTIHRLLHEYLFDNDGVTDEEYRHFSEILDEVAEHSSERERASIECEREVDDLKMCEYMEDHVGEEYDGMISGVNSFGFFVQLDNLIEGLVPIDTLEGFYYERDRDIIISNHSRTIYVIGKEVHVKLERVDVPNRQIDFVLVEKKNEEESKG